MTREQVYFIVRTMVWDEEAALELIEDIYIKIFKLLPQLKKPAGFFRWIRKMTLAEAAAWIKKQQPMVLEVLSAEGNPGTAFSDDRGLELPDCDLTQEQVEAHIEEILCTFPACQRLLAGLYYGQRMSTNEIAETLAVSEDTVREKLSEMRRLLDKCPEAGRRAKTMDLAMTEYLMWLYTGLKAHSAECVLEVILSDIQKKAGDKKGKRAAKAVGVAAMAVAGESVGEVAVGTFKLTDLYMEEDGIVVYEDFIDFYGFYVTEEQLEDEWIRPLGNQYEILEIWFE